MVQQPALPALRQGQMEKVGGAQTEGHQREENNLQVGQDWVCWDQRAETKPVLNSFAARAFVVKKNMNQSNHKTNLLLCLGCAITLGLLPRTYPQPFADAVKNLMPNLLKDAEGAPKVDNPEEAPPDFWTTPFWNLDRSELGASHQVFKRRKGPQCTRSLDKGISKTIRGFAPLGEAAGCVGL